MASRTGAAKAIGSADEEFVCAAESMRLDGIPISLLLCDVNAFKLIDDTFGHAAGDEALQSIARAERRGAQAGCGVPVGRRRVRGDPARHR